MCLREVAKNLEKKSYSPGQKIITEGEVGKELFIINHGIVEVRKADELILQLDDGKYFGEMSNGGLDCFDCPVGRYNPRTGSITSQDCEACANGTWSFVNGSARCEPCPASTFRRGRDIGCQPCS